MLKYLFLHKGTFFISVNNKNGSKTMAEEVNQLISQGFRCLSKDYIEATDEYSAKLQYLNDFVFCGTNGFVVAIHIPTGEELWREKPKGMSYSAHNMVTTLIHRDILICGSFGCAFALNPFTGELIWDNQLPQLGLHPVSIATTQNSVSYCEKIIEVERSSPRY
ncbi:TPA: hypothetical protein I7120_22550 [Vibrio vulnificus]|nr:hypothetical protein [Vibrio vulnificus]